MTFQPSIAQRPWLVTWYDCLALFGGRNFASRRMLMADLTEAEKQEYWRYNVTLTTILLVIWFVVTYLISGLWAGWLNQFSFLGFPLGYYMAAQGSLAIFVIEIAVYAYLMNKLDIKYGIREEG
jgi:putative solute:sodium symporter small subunit